MKSYTFNRNLIRSIEAVDGIETVRYFHAKEDGLYLNVGVKYDPDGGESKWFCSEMVASMPYDRSAEIWEPITEEGYHRIIDDYQVMQYRLIPVA